MPKRKPITGLPKGHVPHYRPPADNSHLFGSHARKIKQLTQQASDAEWAGDFAEADKLRNKADYHRSELAVNGDWAPNF